MNDLLHGTLKTTVTYYFVFLNRKTGVCRDPLWLTRFRGYFFNYGPRFPYNLHSQAVCNLLLFFSSIVHRCWWLYYAWKYQYFFYSQWSRYRALLHFTNIISPIAVYILSVLLAVYKLPYHVPHWTNALW